VLNAGGSYLVQVGKRVFAQIDIVQQRAS
jgi:hypothetical protein